MRVRTQDTPKPSALPAAGLCASPKKVDEKAQDYEKGGEGAGNREPGENSGPDTKREFKASTPTTRRLITCFLPGARHSEFTSCLFKQR